jgi:hypothetical protein
MRTAVLLLSLLGGLAGCTFDVTGLRSDAGLAPTDGLVSAEAGEAGSQQRDAARDSSGDAAQVDAPPSDAPQVDVLQSDVIDPCLGKNCDDANPCTQDGCNNGICFHNVVSGVACEGTKVCLSGSCVACGAHDQPCCAGSACGANLYCANGTTCQPCGAEFETCCPTGASCGTGLKCSSNQCWKCGGEYQLCCDLNPRCGTGLGCGPITGTCLGCGDHYEPCCSSGTPCNGYSCIGGVCL